jgi:hypothetical protein
LLTEVKENFGDVSYVIGYDVLNGGGYEDFNF